MGMEIRSLGKSRSLTNKEAREVLKWMGQELRIDRYKNPIFIELSFIKGLKKVQGASGYCTWEDTNYRPREFSIEVDSNLSKIKTIKTLIHECVHVKQFATCKLQDLVRNFCLKKWDKVVINAICLEYDQYPWEIEAYDLENKYYEKWVEYKKKHK